MSQLLSRSRCSGTRVKRWATVVVPAAVVLTGSFGSTSALAAPGGNAAAHTAAATAASHGNGGVGNTNGNGNAKHDTSSAAGATASDHVTSGTAGTSGNVSDPQPLSNADKNPGGANNGGNCGSYCSTRDGSPSGNGNGGGNATGKPCAGCVGKADNKNPPGQFKDGSDHNAGYECDRNHGIGRSNPAHTGCKTTPPVTCPPGQVLTDGQCVTPPVVCPEGQTMVDGACVTPPVVCPDGQTMVDGACVTPPVVCPDGQTMVDGQCVTDSSGCPEGQTMVNGSCTTTPPTTCPAGATQGANGTCVEGEKQTRKPTVQGEKVVNDPSVLPFTGANVATMLLTGTLVVGAGTMLLVAGARRRRARS